MQTIHDLYRSKLRQLISQHRSQSAFADAIGKSPAQVSQWLSEGARGRHLSPTSARQIEKTLGIAHGWMDQPDAPENPWIDTLPYGDEPDTDVYVEIKRVSLRLSAGISGFAVDHCDDSDAASLWFRRAWLARRGLNPIKLLALDVQGMSMYPGLKPGDTVLVNTASTEMKDGKVFAVNYEGEAVIKRLVRDAGQWWLVSDNPDQATYPRKLCDEHSIIVGQVVHKQSEEI